MSDPTRSAQRHRLESLTYRLRRSAARLAASRRRVEVVAVVGKANSEDEATSAVVDLLDVDTDSAREVVDMPVKAFTRDRVTALEDETQQLEERLTELRSEEG